MLIEKNISYEAMKRLTAFLWREKKIKEKANKTIFPLEKKKKREKNIDYS